MTEKLSNKDTSKKRVHYQISKYIDNELIIEQHTINIHPDSWSIVKQIFIEQGWHVTFNAV